MKRKQTCKYKYRHTGRYLRSLREAKGLSQHALTKGLEFTAQYVSNWERGATVPSVDVLLTIKKYLPLNKNELIDAIQRDNLVELNDKLLRLK